VITAELCNCLETTRLPLRSKRFPSSCGDRETKLRKLIRFEPIQCSARAHAGLPLPFDLSCLSWRILPPRDQGWYDGRDARSIIALQGLIWHAMYAVEMSYLEEQAILPTVITYHLNSRKMSAIERVSRRHIADETIPVRAGRLA
jgi:hypothetical protein